MKTGTLRLIRTTQKPLPAFPPGAPVLVQQSFAACGEVYCSRKIEGIGCLNALYSSRSRMSNRQKAAIAQYLRTGAHDPLFSDWPGQTWPRAAARATLNCAMPLFRRS